VNKSELRLLPLALLLSLAVSSPSRAQSTQAPSSPDRIVFADGDILTGTVLGATSTALSFSNRAVGTLSIKWSELQSIQLSRSSTIFAGTANPARYNLGSAEIKVSASDPHLALTVSRIGGSESVLLNDVTSLGFDSPMPKAKVCGGTNGPCSGWKVSTFKINTTLLLATQKQQTYGAELDLLGNWNPQENGWPHQRTLIQLIPYYNETRKNSAVGSATITQEYEGSIQHLFFLSSDNFYATVLANEYRNNSLGLYFQQSYGLGLGGILHDVELNADLRFIGQHYYRPYPSTA
jgi:hypothetical protein